MTDYLIDGEILGDIADAIREKTSSTDSIPPENMANEIANIPSGVDPDNLATVDKVKQIHATNPTNINHNEYDGIAYDLYYDMTNEVASEIYSSGAMSIRIPVRAGENVEFTQDTDGYIKINATSGGSADDSVVGTWVFNETIETLSGASFELIFNSDGGNYTAVEWGSDGTLHYSWEIGDYSDPVFDLQDGWYYEKVRTITITEEPTDTEFIAWLRANATKREKELPYVKKYVVELTGSENVVDIINQLRDRYSDYQLGVWSLVEFTGATTGLYGLTIQHYGGNTYNISGADFGTFYSMANKVTDWSQVSVWAFNGYFQPPIPYCDDSNNGQVLTVVNGVPTWVTLQ